MTMTMLGNDYSSYTDEEKMMFNHGLLKFVNDLGFLIQDRIVNDPNVATPFDDGFRAGAIIAAMALEYNLRVENFVFFE